MRYLISICILCMSISLQAQDLALAEPAGEILQPVSGCSLGNSENVTIRIFNFGANLPAGTLFIVSYSVNGGAPATELVVLSSTLLSHSSYTYTFSTQANLSSAGNYTIDAVVSLTGDINPINNIFNGYIVTNTAASVGGSVSANQTVCAGVNSGTLSLSGHTGNVVRWETSEDGGLTWRYVSQTGTQQNFLNLTTTTQYRAVVKSGSCPEAVSSIATVTTDCSLLPDLAFGPLGEILQPVSGCSLGSSENVTIRIFNLGANLPAGTLFNISYSINGGTPATELVVLSSMLQSHSSFTHTFITPVNLSAPGNYTFDAVVLLPGDVNPVNNALTSYVVTNSTATAGGNVTTDQIFCGVVNSGTLSLSGHTGNIARWETSEDGGLTWRYVSQTNTQQNFLNLTTTTKYRSVIQNGSCPEAVSSVATVTIGCALPLRWISFDARREGSNVELKWETADEINTSHFAIERASRNDSFQTIGIISASSVSQRYKFTDYNAPAAELLYRIKQVDLDGRFSYSLTQRIRAISKSPSLVLRNNPVVGGTLSFDIQGNVSGNVNVTVFSINGSMIKSSSGLLRSGNNTFHIPLYGIAAGAYWISIQSKDLLINKEFIVSQ